MIFNVVVVLLVSLQSGVSECYYNTDVLHYQQEPNEPQSPPEQLFKLKSITDTNLFKTFIIYLAFWWRGKIYDDEKSFRIQWLYLHVFDRSLYVYE